MNIRGPDASTRADDATSRDVTRALAEVTGSASADGREELREFFAAISGFGKRTRRRYDQLHLPRSRRSVLAICGVGIVLGVMYQYWSRRPPSEMPLGLRGAWVTTAKSYADRGFWIGVHQVAFRTGPGSADIQVYPVTHLAQKRIGADTTLYDIDYAVDGGTDRWSIKHVGLPHPAIVFVHQSQMTWTTTVDPRPPVR